MAVAFATAGQAAASSCVYDAGAKSMSVGMDPGGVTTLAVSGGSLTVDGSPCLGATTTNTDSIAIAGHVGSSERLVLDQRGGLFSPGTQFESNFPEIEMVANLGDPSDTVVVYGTEGDDRTSSGENGIALFGDGDLDVDVEPHNFRLEIHLLGGNDFFNGRGTFGAGLAFKGTILATGGEGNDYLRGSVDNDVIDGGPGNDEIEGNFGNDLIDAGPGDDLVNGGSDNDTIDLGPGADSLIAGSENDVVDAADGEADVSLNGGGHFDTLEYDCAFDAAGKTLTATVTAGGTATLGVNAGAITFTTSSAQDCGGATTSNVDTIKLVGAAGSTETVTIDQTGGAFAPGATPETATGAIGEITIALQLGDAADVVTILGTGGNDSIAAGTKGVGLNADNDVDVTFDVQPTELTIKGMGGVNSLGGRGGSGTGTAYTGRLAFYAGDSGDTILGGLAGDLIFGGAGADVLEGREGADTIDGAGGNDSLAGHGGNDLLIGGSGSDSFIGGSEDDTIRADDDEADGAINGSQGIDTLYYDAGLDSTGVAIENRIAA